MDDMSEKFDEQVVYSDETSDKSLYSESTATLAEWTNAPKVADLKADYTEALPSHQLQMAKVQTWVDNLNVEGSAKIQKRTGRSAVAPKLIRKQAEWRYAALSEPFLSTDDVFNVEPITFEDKASAIQNQLVLNNQFNTKIKKNRFIDEFIRAAVDEGTVVVRVGWEYEEKTVQVEQPLIEEVQITDPMMAAQMAAQGMPPVQQQQVGVEMVDEIQIVKNCPTLEVCNLDNVMVDPTCKGDIEKAQFLIYSFETDLSGLKKDGRYTNLDKINVSGNSVLSEPDHHSTIEEAAFNFKDKPRQKFVAYEYWGYWDINKTGIVEPIVATYVGDTIIRMEANPFPDQKIPFVMAQMLPKRNSSYGEPDGALLEDNQKIVGAVTRGMIDIMGRSANGQLGIRKDALDVTNRRKYERGLDYEFNAQVDPRQAFHMGAYPEIPKSAETMIGLQNQEAESLTGVKAFSSGLSGQALGNTATGIRGTLDATSKRELGILRRLATCISEAGRKILAMNAEFLSEEETIRITNEEFVQVRRDDLAGNFDLRLTISTAETDNEKAQELAFMLQTMGNSMDPSMGQMLLEEIAMLRKMPALAKRIKEYQPQPNPLEEERASLEVELLRAQVANENAKAQENQVDIQLKMAKTRNLESKSDSEDLAFLEKESGADVDKELQKKDFDRRAQLDLKAADGMLKGDAAP
tara:strand:- start:1042 stop:3117 length:2076 start_codon:yes stop_codon:yes gene_type:complete